MKKVVLLILVILTVFCFLSCQQASSEIQSPNQPWAGSMLRTYASRFDYFWNAMNSHYVFWDIDPTDWDAIYKTYMPKFEEIDKIVAEAAAEKKAEAQSNAFESAKTNYTELTKTLIDHHMAIIIFDPYRDGYKFVIRPCESEVKSREYYHPMSTSEREESSGQYLIKWTEKTEIAGYFGESGPGTPADGYKTVTNLMSDEETAVLLLEKYNPETGKGEAIKDGVVDNYCLAYDLTIDRKSSTGSDMHVVYLAMANYCAFKWLPAYDSSPSVCPSETSEAFDWEAGKTLYSFFAAVRKYYDSGELAGVILDNRANRGGDNTDFEYIIGLYADKPIIHGYTKYKEGFGKTDYSAYIPMGTKLRTDFTEYYCDLVSADIPYVVLCDLNSVSCGEASSAAVSTMQNGYVIGERTWGATGPLKPDPAELVLTYGGTFGDKDKGPVYVYTSTFNTRTYTKDGYKSIEGIGFTPDKEIYFKSTGKDNLVDDMRTMLKAQIREALSFISGY